MKQTLKYRIKNQFEQQAWIVLRSIHNWLGTTFVMMNIKVFTRT